MAKATRTTCDRCDGEGYVFDYGYDPGRLDKDTETEPEIENESDEDTKAVIEHKSQTYSLPRAQQQPRQRPAPLVPVSQIEDAPSGSRSAKAVLSRTLADEDRGEEEQEELQGTEEKKLVVEMSVFTESAKQVASVRNSEWEKSMREFNTKLKTGTLGKSRPKKAPPQPPQPPPVPSVTAGTGATATTASTTSIASATAAPRPFQPERSISPPHEMHTVKRSKSTVALNALTETYIDGDFDARVKAKRNAIMAQAELDRVGEPYGIPPKSPLTRLLRKGKVQKVPGE